MNKDIIKHLINGFRCFTRKDIKFLVVILLISIIAYKKLLWFIDYNIMLVILSIGVTLIYMAFKGLFFTNRLSKEAFKFRLVGFTDKFGYSPKLKRIKKPSFSDIKEIRKIVYNYKTKYLHEYLELLEEKTKKQGRASYIKPRKTLLVKILNTSYIQAKKEYFTSKFSSKITQQAIAEFNRFSVVEMEFYSNIILENWKKKKNELENIFNTNIVDIRLKTNSKKMIVVSTQKYKDNTVIYKDEKKKLDERYKDILERLGLNITDIKVVDSDYNTIIHIDTLNTRSDIEKILPELKDRMKIRRNTFVQLSKEKDFSIFITKKIGIITFEDIFKQEYQKISQLELPVILGKNSKGKNVIVDLVKNYHTIVAGTTGGGKTNTLHTIMLSLLLQNSNCVFCFLDPKKTEFKDYRFIKKVVYKDSPKDMLKLIEDLVIEMDRRNKLFNPVPFCTNIEEYNEMTGSKLPYIIVMIEELADLICQGSNEEGYVKRFEKALQRLSQMGRSTGFRLYLATQKPNADTISTYVKTNCVTRICFFVPNTIDSNVVLDNSKGSKLLKDLGQFIYQIKGIDTVLQAPLLPIEQKIKLVTYLQENQ